MFELKFNPEKQMVVLNFKIEGELGSDFLPIMDNLKKLFAIKINPKNQLSFWVDSKMLIIKRNDHMIKQTQISLLTNSHEFAIKGFN